MSSGQSYKDNGGRELDALWKPLALAGTVIQNRVMMSALTLQYGDHGKISERHLAFYRERAIGGVGLIFSEQLEATSFSGSPFSHALRAYDYEAIEGFARITAVLKPFETKFFGQLFAGGAASSSTYGLSDWSPVRAPSRVGVPEGEVPLPLTREELKQIAQHFTRSALHLKQAVRS